MAAGELLTIAELWRDAVRRHAGRPLLRADEDGSTLSYAEAGEVVAALERRLAAAGIAKGDRIVLVAPFHPASALVCWASWCLGAVVVPLDPSLDEGALVALCARVEPALVFCGRGQAGTVAATGLPVVPLEDGPGPPSLAAWLWEDLPGAEPGSGAGPGDPAAILFTSGTSGAARGVVLSQSALCRSGALMAASYGWAPADVLLNLGELHTMSGLRNPCLAVLQAGCSLVAASLAVRSSAPLVGACIQRQRATLLACVPAMLLQFERAGARITPGALGTLRMVLCTGSRLPDAWAERFEGRFKVPVLNYYGLTETGGLCAGAVPGGSGRHSGAIGVPLGCRVAIQDEQGRPVAAGGAGELLIASGQLMTGYWRDPERTAQVLRDGWFRTGDLVRQAPDDTLILIDRRSEAFKDARGEFIHPAEIEQVLEGHPAVAEAGVCLRAGADGGDRLTAFIVPRDPAAAGAELEGELRVFAAERLGGFRTPADFRWTEALPRGTNAKLLRRELRGDIHGIR